MDKRINIPNALTSVRLLLSIPLFIFITRGDMWMSLLILVLAGITELDGTIARKFNQITVFGSIYDPIADGIFALTGFVALIISGKLQIIFLIPLALVNLPRLIYINLYLKEHGEVKSAALSKISAFLVTLIVPLAIIGFDYLNHYIIIVTLFSAVIMIKRGTTRTYA